MFFVFFVVKQPFLQPSLSDIHSIRFVPAHFASTSFHPSRASHTVTFSRDLFPVDFFSATTGFQLRKAYPAPIVVFYCFFLSIPVRRVHRNLSVVRYLFVFSARSTIYIFYIFRTFLFKTLSVFFRLPYVTVLKLLNSITLTFPSLR